MQETPAPVYVVATANDVRTLKPELLRRFDDIFWVDLPNASDRETILNVHLQKRGRKPLTSEELAPVVSSTWGFTGSEMEKVVKSALENAFFQKRALAVGDLMAASSRIVPISQTMGEKIAELRSWATNRALFASEPLEPKPVEKVNISRKIEM
jgi:SpoVK/Ycf46/Vps4 family AAA+-type ATPase